jgi:ribosomal-protein-alanine N-acetyltransferase
VKSAGQAVKIRRMIAADLGRVMEIGGNLPEAPHWPQAAYLDALNPDSTPRRIALVAASGSVQGFAVASLLPPQAELESIAVASESQRQGAGRKLIGALTGELRLAGVQDLWLEVRASNQAAQNFYRSLGFAETGRRKAYYADPIEDAVLMLLHFGSPIRG